MNDDDFARFMGCTTPVVDDYGDEHLLWTGFGTNLTLRPKKPSVPTFRLTGAHREDRARRLIYEHHQGATAARVSVSCDHATCMAHVVAMSELSAFDRAKRATRKRKLVLGVPSDVPARAAAAAVSSMYRDRHMRVADIADACAISNASVVNLLSEEPHPIRLWVHRAVMAAVRGTLPVNEPRVRQGADTPNLGTRRRLQGFAAEGFPHQFVADGCGMNRSSVSNLAQIGTASGLCTWGTVATIEAFSRKMEGSHPEDFGIDQASISKARTHARKKGWAPRMCWDEDSIDNPSASPEWTGACGTSSGYYVHLREGISVMERDESGAMTEYVACARCRPIRRIEGAIDDTHAVIRDWASIYMPGTCKIRGKIPNDVKAAYHKWKGDTDA